MLNNKIVAVTNVKHYMGPATVKVFQQENAKLYLFDRDIVEAKKVLQEFEVDTDAVTFYEVKENSSKQINQALSSIYEETGRLDVLVNVNTHPPGGGSIVKTTDDEWREMHHQLLDELFYWTRAALQYMIPQKAGKIVNFTSAAGLVGLPNYTPYATARAAANGFTQSIGKEVAKHNIQVNAIAQNFVENPTYFPKELLADEKKVAKIVSRVPAGRLAKGEESAHLALFLASDRSDFFCGQVLPFAGGWA